MTKGKNDFVAAYTNSHRIFQSIFDPSTSYSYFRLKYTMLCGVSLIAVAFGGGAPKDIYGKMNFAIAYGCLLTCTVFRFSAAEFVVKLNCY